MASRHHPTMQASSNPPRSQAIELRELEGMLFADRIPRKPWQEVGQDIYKRWRPKDSPHHSIICLSGGGKSFLATRGLLPMRGWRRALIIDNKGDDPTLRNVGKRVRQLPRNDPWMQSKKHPDHSWYRLDVYDDWRRAREQVKDALAHVYRQGNWTI